MSIDTIKSYIEVWDCHGCLPYGGTQHNVMAVDDLEYLPTIEAEPVRHGRWIKYHTDYGSKWNCSVCCLPTIRVGIGISFEIERFAFCPFCGARMDGGVKK